MEHDDAPFRNGPKPEQVKMFSCSDGFDVIEKAINKWLSENSNRIDVLSRIIGGAGSHYGKAFIVAIWYREKE